MRFEHVIIINDPTDLMTSPLTMEQVWQGLLLRARAPQLFMQGVERVSVDETDATLILREMQLGNLMVRDRIHLEAPFKMHFDTEANDQHPGGQLYVTVEAPANETLIIRFVYETPHDDSGQGEEAQLLGYLKAAYRANDVDAVRRIRELAEAGKLEG
ncbi:SRPBCC family protein [Chitinivorax sp. B]|uniref:SRPBCC family protein n=1 Tax=Chitinivorax sp. B TaxID=2502235 RepID=UPI0010F88B59|nr:SRPBCC family protein [Chitinivorax sp. B]